MKLKKIIASAAISALVSTAALANVPTNTNGAFSPNQVQDIQKIVHDYLVKNPSVLIEASQALQAQQMQAQEKAATKAIAANKQDIFNNPNTPTGGNAKGNTYLVEFFDYQCGHCKQMSPVIQALLKADNNVKIIYKELPIFGDNSRFAALAALASITQSKYEAFHNALLKTTVTLTNAKVLEVAKSVGIDTAKLQSDMKNPAYTTQLRDNFNLAQKLSLSGTPAFIVANTTLSNFKFIPGAVPQNYLEKAMSSVNSNDAAKN